MALTKSEASTWHVYVLRTREGHLYTGVATDVERRIKEHETDRSRGAKSLRGRGPLMLEFRCPIGGQALALRVEHAVKRLSRSGKEALVSAGPGAKELLRRLEIQEET